MGLGTRKTPQADRIVPLDRARTYVTLLVLLHHSVAYYTHFGHGDAKTWLGFDLIVLFNDSFFMAFMFLVSGLFVFGEWTRKSTRVYLRDRTRRLGVPFLVSIVVLVPLAYYPTFLRYHLPETTDFDYGHFWWRTLTIGPWPSGPAWFLWVLLALDVIASAMLAGFSEHIRALSRRLAAHSGHPIALFAAYLILTVVAYVPLRLLAGEAGWLEFGPLPIQTSRILLYAGSFLAGVVIGATDLRSSLLTPQGPLAARWALWLAWATVCYAAILTLVYLRHTWIESAASPPESWSLSYSLAFAMFSASMTFAVPAIMLQFSNRHWGLLDPLQPSAYGVFLVHYVFIIWLQYALFAVDIPALAKFAIVFAGTLSLSWLVTLALRRIPLIAKII